MIWPSQIIPPAAILRPVPIKGSIDSFDLLKRSIFQTTALQLSLVSLLSEGGVLIIRKIKKNDSLQQVNCKDYDTRIFNSLPLKLFQSIFKAI